MKDNGVFSPFLSCSVQGYSADVQSLNYKGVSGWQPKFEETKWFVSSEEEEREEGGIGDA
jgi:hypothetical protein